MHAKAGEVAPASIPAFTKPQLGVKNRVYFKLKKKRGQLVEAVMEQPSTHTGKAERLRFCTQRVQLLAPQLLTWGAAQCPASDGRTLRALAARPPPTSLRPLLEQAQTYTIVKLGVATIAEALSVCPRADLHSPETVESSLWMFLLRFFAGHETALLEPSSFESVEVLRSELADFLYMHCELDFTAEQTRKPATVVGQREKVKLCKLHIQKLSAFLLGEPLPKDVFVARLGRADAAFAEYVRTGVAALSQLVALPLNPSAANEPAEALWEYLQGASAPDARALGKVLDSFLEFYSVLE